MRAQRRSPDLSRKTETVGDADDSIAFTIYATLMTPGGMHWGQGTVGDDQYEGGGMH